MKVGDKVTIKANKYDLGGHYEGFPISKPGAVAYITEILSHGAQLATYPDCDPDEHSEQSLFFRFDEFEVVKEEGFKFGDRVRLSTQGIRQWKAEFHDDPSNPIFVDGTVHDIVEEYEHAYDMGFRYRVTWDNDTKNSYMEGDLENAA